MTTTLGRLEDLPQSYRDELAAQNLVPLWPSLRAVLPPGQPRPNTRATHWAYQGLRPLLLRAGELTPIEKAERRVLVLANPGHGLEKMQASAAIYLGMQLLLPGEWAPSHRHTPNAVRMIVEGEGAYTTVDGEKCVMQRGDLILTPTGLWHEHGHEGTTPVVWLDVLDLPLMYYLEVSYHVDGTRQPAKNAPRPASPSAPRGGSSSPAEPDLLDGGTAERAYAMGGVLPAPMFERSAKPYPMLRYPWVDVRRALESLAQAQPDTECVQVRYVNPETGADCQNVLGYSALMLRPGQALRLPARSPAAVFHLIEGAADVQVGTQGFSLAEADTCCAPGFTPALLTNRSARAPAFVFIADETPLHRKLGVLETRG